MKLKIVALGILAIGTQTALAQTIVAPPKKVEFQKQTKTKAAQMQKPADLRERREQAYAKLLEGQRYIWNLKRRRSKKLFENSFRA